MGAPESKGGPVATLRRGGLAILGAKIFFIFAGLAQQVLLPHAIGLAGFGAFSRVMGKAAIINNVVVGTSIQSMSRAVARAGDEAATIRAAMRVHIVIAVLLAGCFAAAAPALAAFEFAPHIKIPLVVMAGVTLIYGIYAPLVGALNGKGLFSKQAGLDALTAALRVFTIVGIGAIAMRAWDRGVLGASAGAVLAAVCVLPVAVYWVSKAFAGSHSTHDPNPIGNSEWTRAYLLAMAPMAATQLFAALLMQVDAWLLGRFLSETVPESMTIASADEWVGVYKACQLFAFLPYQILMSINQVLFPVVARAQSTGNLADVTAVVTRGARIAAIACGLFAAVMVAMPHPLITFAYGSSIADRGASILRVLCVGQVAFTLFGLAAAVLTGLGRARLSAALSAIVLVAMVIGCGWVVPGEAFGQRQLMTTAAVVVGAMTAGVVMAAATVNKVAGGFISWRTVLRVSVAVIIVAFVGSKIPEWGRLATPFVALGLALLYAAILAILGELKSDFIAGKN